MAKASGTASGSITLREYAASIEATDKIDPSDMRPILMGLFGEVGGIMTAAKKHVREEDAYPRFRRAAEDEFGDTLWYFTRLCARLGFDVDTIFSMATKGNGYSRLAAATDLAEGPIAQVAVPVGARALDPALFQLGRCASDLLNVEPEAAEAEQLLIAFADSYLSALSASDIRLAEVARANVAKARGRFIPPDPRSLPVFDSEFDADEQIPWEFSIRISQRRSGKSYLQWNGVFIGDPLTDNIADADGYRFHDVFHLAYASILHWSPVFRALIKQKRKSVNVIDESQDSGRPIVVEEGLTAWIFSRAKELNFFEGQRKLSFDILKTIQEFVEGYEVGLCPLSLWERAVLDGYSVFRKVRAAEGGWVIGNRRERSLVFRPLGDDE